MQTRTIDSHRRIGFTSDSHLGHGNILRYCLRPWLSDEERQRVARGERFAVDPEHIRAHDDALIERTNAILGPDDVLVHCGDVAWNEDDLANYRERLSVREVYVLVGNHDDESQLARLFGRDFVFDRLELFVGRQRVILDHYPQDVWHQSHHGSYHLYGHCHGASDARRRLEPRWNLSLDVGVDSHDYRPWLWREELHPLLLSRHAGWDASRHGQTDKEFGGMRPAE